MRRYGAKSCTQRFTVSYMFCKLGNAFFSIVSFLSLFHYFSWFSLSLTAIQALLYWKIYMLYMYTFNGIESERRTNRTESAIFLIFSFDLPDPGLSLHESSFHWYKIPYSKETSRKRSERERNVTVKKPVKPFLQFSSFVVLFLNSKIYVVVEFLTV